MNTVSKIKRKEKTPVLLQNRIGEVEYLTFPALEQTKAVGHLFSTRLGGVSTGELASMNLSYSRGDKKENVDENYRRILKVLNRNVSDVVCSDQTHTTHIRRVTKPDCGKGVLIPRDYTDVDGLITDEPGIVLATFYADCVPIYLVDPVTPAIGLVHSGWRGTAGRIGAEAVKRMNEEYGSRPQEMVAAIGPSICKDCYEIGADVAEAFQAAFAGVDLEKEGILFPKEGGKYQLDLWEANVRILMEAGVKREHISVTDLCTCCNPQYLFSHRASHGRRGNLGAFLTLFTDEERKLRSC